MVATPFGLLMAWGRQLKLVDCGQNRVYEISGPRRDTIDQAFRAFDSAGQQLAMIYLRDTVYWISGGGKKLSVRKLRLSKSDFDTRSGTPLYTTNAAQKPESIKTSASSGLDYTWVFLLVLGASALAFFAGRKLKGRRSNNPVTRIKEQHTPEGNLTPAKDAMSAQPRFDDSIGFFLQHLTPVEADLLREIARLSLQDRKMETDAINKILGVYNKDPEIQKARRSNAITHINNTFTQTTRRSGLLIQRQRDEIDKRVYVYFIPYELACFVSDGWTGLREA